MLRKVRMTLAIVVFVLLTLIFLDVTGSVRRWFGWLAEIQFWPAVLALNVAVVALLLLLTLVFGRILGFFRQFCKICELFFIHPSETGIISPVFLFHGSAPF